MAVNTYTQVEENDIVPNMQPCWNSYSLAFKGYALFLSSP